MSLFSERKSFVTGSMAYGESYRNAKSDVDLVVYVSEETLAELKPFIDKTVISTGHSIYGKSAKGGRIKMGDIDLILVTDKEDFDRWKRITDHLKSIDCLTRNVAVETFRDRTGQFSY